MSFPATASLLPETSSQDVEMGDRTSDVGDSLPVPPEDVEMSTEVASTPSRRYVAYAPLLTACSEQALAFLESYPREFLKQLSESLKEVAEAPPGRRRKGRPVPGIELTLLSRKTGNEKTVRFPDDPKTENAGPPALEAMARIMHVAQVLYQAILTNGTVTMREIYYRNTELFRNQAQVDALVDDLVATAGLKRQDFHVCASSKGLAVSNTLVLELVNGEELVLSDTTPTLIPPAERIASVTARDGLERVLVVEKDAILGTLCGDALLSHPQMRSTLLLTGKGYPDLATLQLLRLVADRWPTARIFVLVDGDPHGLSILNVYKYGSKNNRHNADYAGLALGDRAEWLGVKPSELLGSNSLIPLTDNDTQRAIAMSRSPNLDPEWRRELSHMLMYNRKAEIEALCDAPTSDLSQILEGGSHASGPRLVEYILERM